MLKKRVIPCLDVTGGRVVKGVNFLNLRDAGDPVELATHYDREGADELIFLDITASSDGRRTMIDVVHRTAEQVFIPFTVGGGIRTIEDIREMLLAGADKVGITSAAIKNPDLIDEAAGRFGSQCIVLSMDVRRVPGSVPVRWEPHLNGGRVPTGMDAVEWAIEGVRRGAGELLLNSMDADGTKDGYDNELNAIISSSVNVPVIASGGAGKPEHLYDALTVGKADAVLAASIFHFGEYRIREVKEYLSKKGVSIRVE